MGVQTSISDNPDIAYEGQQSESPFPSYKISRKAQVAINNGQLVSQGTADDQAKLPTVSGDVTAKALGVAVYDPSKCTTWPAGNTVQYPIGEAVQIMRRGTAYVKVEEAVVAQDPVYVRYAAGAGGTTLGAFRKSADTATAAQLPNCMYLTSAAANGMALVEFNL